MKPMANVEQEALDRVMIHEVVALSAGLLYDTGDWNALEQLWATDGVFDVLPNPDFTKWPLVGRDAIVGMYRDRQPKAYLPGPRRHIITNIVVDELTATTARCRSYMTLLSVLSANLSGSLQLIGAATYFDELRKEDGRWQITYRRSELYGGSFTERNDPGVPDR
jgi:hypothetical protein